VKRLAPILALIGAAIVVLALVAASSGGGDRYLVRAIFDNAGFVIPGEDVKVAGVKVGKVESLDVTEDDKAAVVLDIEDPGYQDFRADAECEVRPQSLIGEKFVECTPTQKRTPGAATPPPLREVDGQRLLPVERTSKSVDLDLINNIMREPYRERLSIILNELGTGVAGRGRDLDEVVRRANPALRELDKVLAILAGQNRTLSSLARDSDTILEPLARERKHVSSFVTQAGETAEATVERGSALEADFERLPTFLRELKPTMRRLGGLADEMTPVLADLGDVAPDVNRLLIETGPFAKAGVPAFETLGEATKVGTPALRDAHPVVNDLGALGKISRPVGGTLADALTSLRKTGGLERAMDFILYTVTAINGFDEAGHYLRAGLLLNQCANYAVTPVGGCSAKFREPEPESEEASATAAAKKPQAKPHRKTRKPRERAKPRAGGHRQRGQGLTPSPGLEQTPPQPAATATVLLDYLFGADER
jgi:phospholipid/cholesterol/gamma-HCH transport system substrate-binding protein